MNFAQMLSMEVKPMPDTREPRPEKKEWRDASVMHDARHKTAAKKYCAAVGPDWTSTAAVADRLGMARMSIYKQLVRYAEFGIIERRPAGGEPYSHYRGWEWRVK